MIFRELSNAAFRFFSTATRSRDHGGRSNAPPPQQEVENPEAQQGAG